MLAENRTGLKTIKSRAQFSKMAMATTPSRTCELRIKLFRRRGLYLIKIFRRSSSSIALGVAVFNKTRITARRVLQNLRLAELQCADKSNNFQLHTSAIRIFYNIGLAHTRIRTWYTRVGSWYSQLVVAVLVPGKRHLTRISFIRNGLQPASFLH